MKIFDKYKILVILSICVSAISLSISVLGSDRFGARTESVWRQYNSNAYFGSNVGINTTDPNEKLTLNQGNIATEIEVPSLTKATTTISSNLATSTYYFKLVAIDGVGGTTTASSEVSQQTTATTTGVRLTWTGVSGVEKYLIFWATSTGAQTKYFPVTATSTYTFSTTTGATTGSIPSTNTAYVNKISYNGASWINGINFGIGTTTPGATLGVINGAATATIIFGSVFSGSSSAKICYWNGIQYTTEFYSSGSTTKTVATSTVCQ